MSPGYQKCLHGDISNAVYDAISKTRRFLRRTRRYECLHGDIPIHGDIPPYVYIQIFDIIHSSSRTSIYNHSFIYHIHDPTLYIYIYTLSSHAVASEQHIWAWSDQKPKLSTVPGLNLSG